MSGAAAAPKLQTELAGIATKFTAVRSGVSNITRLRASPILPSISAARRVSASEHEDLAAARADREQALHRIKRHALRVLWQPERPQLLGG